MRYGFTFISALALSGALGSQALAGAFAPVGLWQGESSGNVLLVWGEGFCSTGGSVTIGGPCTWAAEDRSGTLSMRTSTALESQSLELAVSWLDQNTILVNGTERYKRKG